MKTFRVHNTKTGQIAYMNNEVVGSMTLGPRGGQWGASGYLNPSYYIKKGDGTTETYVDFGTKNAKRYNAVIFRFHTSQDGSRLFARIVKKTSKWIHHYTWEVVPINN